MPTFFLIPTITSPQTFSISLAGKVYTFVLTYHPGDAEQKTGITAYDSDSHSTVSTNDMSSWILDIYDSASKPMVCGMPLVPGIDLLNQYQYLNFGGSLLVVTPADPDRVPGYSDLGKTSGLYFVTFP